MTIRTTLIASSLIAASLVSGAAQAALVDRGGGLIYDDVLNVTWLQDANYAHTSGYNVGGQMTWPAATTWAANLSYFDSVRNVTYTDWRLPTVSPINGTSFNVDAYTMTGESDYGFNISAPGTTYAGSTANEMAYMYYVNLGNPGYYLPISTVTPSGCGIDSSCLRNVGPFTNLQSYVYWSETPFPPDEYAGVQEAFRFETSTGFQGSSHMENYAYAWAVRPGDVAAVPEAETYALMLAGLALVGAAARRRRG